ncbi:putative membrane protein [Secundilactobacillus oryzae JCM 18671]|uniref:Putative membrane protein n=1 Tax=Secundilactobacillus oryzae JCM 18671 TaxID=1291743 RepID=A0A081BKM6_9LACO|nr:AzlD domain-containing protein [Secundilactobacillus oryzae]GAK48594.1 putative membrane protein [Secundilactobacillus oryzae JCM 18671]
MSLYVFLAIVVCGFVTIASRVLPFILVKQFELPAFIVKFLSFMPITIMSALMFENMLIARSGQLPLFDWQNIWAAIPAVIAGILTKSLLVIVVVGIVAMAALRFYGIG